jgi:hypothetical protein
MSETKGDHIKHGLLMRKDREDKILHLYDVITTHLQNDRGNDAIAYTFLENASLFSSSTKTDTGNIINGIMSRKMGTINDDGMIFLKLLLVYSYFYYS